MNGFGLKGGGRLNDRLLASDPDALCQDRAECLHKRLGRIKPFAGIFVQHLGKDLFEFQAQSIQVAWNVLKFGLAIHDLIQDGGNIVTTEGDMACDEFMGQYTKTE